MTLGTLMIRADASVAIGTGHVMRCLALAQKWQDSGGRAVFAMTESTPSLGRSLHTQGMQVVELKSSAGTADAKELARVAQDHDATWVVVDGYAFDSEYQCTLKNAGLNLTFLDDYGQCGRYSADLVLDQNANAKEAMYRNREPYTRLLLGARFALLRREFRQRGPWTREIPGVARRLLITIGGSDPDNLTLGLIQTLQRNSALNVETTVVVGGSNPDLGRLQRTAQAARRPMRIVSDARNMAEIMAQSDMAIICGGGTLWELLYMGCPTLSYSRGAVQAGIVAELEAAGIIRNLGPVGDFDEGKLTDAVEDLAVSRHGREKMSLHGPTLVDGHGVDRVFQCLATEKAA